MLNVPADVYFFVNTFAVETTDPFSFHLYDAIPPASELEEASKVTFSSLNTVISAPASAIGAIFLISTITLSLSDSPCGSVTVNVTSCCPPGNA